LNRWDEVPKGYRKPLVLRTHLQEGGPPAVVDADLLAHRAAQRVVLPVGVTAAVVENTRQVAGPIVAVIDRLGVVRIDLGAAVEGVHRHVLHAIVNRLGTPYFRSGAILAARGIPKDYQNRPHSSISAPVPLSVPHLLWSV